MWAVVIVSEIAACVAGRTRLLCAEDFRGAWHYVVGQIAND